MSFTKLAFEKADEGAAPAAAAAGHSTIQHITHLVKLQNEEKVQGRKHIDSFMQNNKNSQIYSFNTSCFTVSDRCRIWSMSSSQNRRLLSSSSLQQTESVKTETQSLAQGTITNQTTKQTNKQNNNTNNTNEQSSTRTAANRKRRVWVTDRRLRDSRAQRTVCRTEQPAPDLRTYIHRQSERVRDRQSERMKRDIVRYSQITRNTSMRVIDTQT